MPEITIHRVPAGEPLWEDLDRKEVIYLGKADDQIRLCFKEEAPDRSKSMVMVRLDLPGGKVVMSQTTVEEFLAVVGQVVQWEIARKARQFEPPRDQGI